ncbi:MAG: hypothetical protein KJ600_01835 [Nanoarchaeota archaeon]|nr:hypothetical protein [Nanoarchaeota archaeon]MBU1103276.1 hypothetical protein [Nanoarchaeota archaeon]
MKKLFFMFFVIGLFLPIVHASIDAEINVQKSFVEGDVIRFDYSLTSQENVFAEYMTYVECPHAPVGPFQTKNINLLKNQPQTFKHSDFFIDGMMIEPQTCTAYLELLSPEKKTISKEFTIDTLPSFKFSLDICKEEACLKQLRVYPLGSEVFIGYSSDVITTPLSVMITYPDKTKQQLTLPTTIKVSQAGTYSIAVTASEKGYKTASRQEDFEVIEQELTRINEVDFSRVRLSPQTMTERSLFEKGLLIAASIVLLTAIILFFRKKKVLSCF